MIWLMSDTHWHHANIIPYCHRPFGRVADLAELLAVEGRDAYRARLRADWDARKRLESACAEMDAHMLARVHAVTKPGDIILHAGDLALCDIKSLGALMAAIDRPLAIIFGNHDKVARRYSGIFAAALEKLDGDKFLVQHRPAPNWPGRDAGRVLLHGHVHDKPWHCNAGRAIDLCPEKIGYDPVDPESLGITQKELASAMLAAGCAI